VIEGIETIAQAKAYHILIYFTFESYLKEVSILKHLSNGRVDGIILSLSAETSSYEHIKELKDRNVPLVFLIEFVKKLKLQELLRTTLLQQKMVQNTCWMQNVKNCFPQFFKIFSYKYST